MEHSIGPAAQTSDLTDSQHWRKSCTTAHGGGEANPASSREVVHGPDVPRPKQGIRAGPPTVCPLTVLPINVTDIDSSRQHGQTANRRLL